MFDLDQFVADIRSTLVDRSRRGTKDVVARAVSDSGSLLRCLGEPSKAGIQVLHHAADLTILNLAWGPGQMTLPHDHRLWAVIGMYGGREDNVYWRRVPDQLQHSIDIAGGRALIPGDVEVLGQDIIHSVVNPLSKLSGAIHVYGGDFFGVRRSQWNPATLAEEPYDHAQARQMYENANAAMART